MSLNDDTTSLTQPRSDWWWTGKSPQKTLRSLPLPNTANFTRQSVIEYFDNTWTLTEILFSSLVGEEAFYILPYHGLRHPMIFYYVHPAVLYVNKFLVAGLIEKPVNPHFESLFETGVDEMPWDDTSKKNSIQWPAVSECTEYRRNVYALVRNVLETHPGLDETQILDTHPCWAIFMGLEHERIHLETSSVLITELPLRLVKKPIAWPEHYPSSGSKVDNLMIPVNGGQVRLGKPRSFPSYGWDNEYGSQVFQVRPFEAGKYQVTNGEFLEFVKAIGYNAERYWSSEGWAWRSFRNAKWPYFWIPCGPQGLHQYKQRLLFDVIDLPLDWPVIVNVHEAQAYCKWKSEVDKVTGQPYRLLTETEHNMIREHIEGNVDSSNDYVMAFGGSDIFQKSAVNAQLAFSSPSSVADASVNSKGFSGVFGNVWHWCSDYVSPLYGFKAHPYYQDFSDPCFDGKHHIILGGSFISTGSELSIWSRFHFRAHFFQHAGFRMARNTDGREKVDTTSKAYYAAEKKGGKKGEGWRVYESDKMLREYLDLHYGKPDDIFSLGCGPRDALEFPKRCAMYTIKHVKKLNLPNDRVLDVGCAVGASTFYLSTHFKSAQGVDICERFIKTASHLAEVGSISTERFIRGELHQPWVAEVPHEIDRTRVNFRCADACNLPLEWGKYDTIMMANLLCRLPDPLKCLDLTKELLNPGGLLVVMTPFSWMPEYTSKEKWIGATLEHPDSFEVLRYYLEELGFRFLKRKTMPLVIREHERKFQYILSEASVWQIGQTEIK